MHSIHITTARAILAAPEPVDISVWKADGSLLHLRNCVSLHADRYGGWRNVRLLDSGQVRRIRDCCIYAVNGLEVFL